MRTSSIVLALAASFATACSAAAPGDETGSQTAALAPATPTFFVAAASTQGGFDLTSVNMAAVSHVTTIDYSGAGLDQATIAALQSLPPTELVLAGTISGDTLAVSTAYEGMPGMTYSSSATFYQASGDAALVLNESLSGSFTSVDVSAAAAPYVQPAWLSAQVAAGAIVAGQTMYGSNALGATQVFIALPYTSGPCVISSEICPSATPLPTYTRDTNLCVDFAGCASLGICNDFIPECWQGYTLSSWRAGADACMQYACDPTFVHGS